MMKNMKPCPKCGQDELGVRWSKDDDAGLLHSYGVVCRWCSYFMEGSTVRVLTAASKASAWRRTKAKWNKLARCKKCGGTGLYVGNSMGGAVFDLDCDECDSAKRAEAMG